MARTQTLVCSPRRRRRRSRRSVILLRTNPAKRKRKTTSRRNPARKTARRNPSSGGSTSATLVFRGQTSAGNPSAKGWVCEQSGTRVTFTWGKIGGPGKRIIKSFSSAADAADYARRSIKAKRDKGYTNGSPRFSSVTAAPSRSGGSKKKKASKKKRSASKAAPKRSASKAAPKKRSGTGRKARRAARRQAARGGERRSAQIRRHAAALARAGGAGLGPADRPSLWGGWDTAPISQPEYVAALARASKGKRSSKSRPRNADGTFAKRGR